MDLDAGGVFILNQFLTAMAVHQPGNLYCLGMHRLFSLLVPQSAELNGESSLRFKTGECPELSQ